MIIEMNDSVYDSEKHSYKRKRKKTCNMNEITSTLINVKWKGTQRRPSGNKRPKSNVLEDHLNNLKEESQQRGCHYSNKAENKDVYIVETQEKEQDNDFIDAGGVEDHISTIEGPILVPDGIHYRFDYKRERKHASRLNANREKVLQEEFCISKRKRRKEHVHSMSIQRENFSQKGQQISYRIEEPLENAGETLTNSRESPLKNFISIQPHGTVQLLNHEGSGLLKDTSDIQDGNQEPRKSSVSDISPYSAPSVLLVCCKCKREATVQSEDYIVLPAPGDRNYMFKCADCTQGKPLLEHLPKTWTEIALTAIYNLQVRHCRKYFHSKLEICDFVDRHWNTICIGKTRTTTWWATLHAQITQNKHLFGTKSYGSGYWGIVHENSKWRTSSVESSMQTTQTNQIRKKMLTEKRKKLSQSTEKILPSVVLHSINDTERNGPMSIASKPMKSSSSSRIHSSRRFPTCCNEAFINENNLLKTKCQIYTAMREDASEIVGGMHNVQQASDEGKVFVVEKILGKRYCGGQVQYLLKWKDYPDTCNTWEREDDLLCPELIKTFERKKPDRIARRRRKQSQQNTNNDPKRTLENEEPSEEAHSSIQLENIAMENENKKMKREPEADKPCEELRDRSSHFLQTDMDGRLGDLQEHVNLDGPSLVKNGDMRGPLLLKGATCHQCRNRKSALVNCTSSFCSKRYCEGCLQNHYHINIWTLLDRTESDWICPNCRNQCLCITCKRNRGELPASQGVSKPPKKQKKHKKKSLLCSLSQRHSKASSIVHRSSDYDLGKFVTYGSLPIPKKVLVNISIPKWNIIDYGEENIKKSSHRLPSDDEGSSNEDTSDEFYLTLHTNELQVYEKRICELKKEDRTSITGKFQSH